MRIAFFVTVFLAFLGTYESLEASRLLVAVDPSASFTAEEFAEKSGATLIRIDSRNPYRSFQDCFLETPYVVIAKDAPDENIRRLNYKLSLRYGYRCKTFSEGSLEEAVSEAQRLLEAAPTTSSEIPKLSLEEQNRLYELMRKIDAVLTQGKIQYWAGRETLLGASHYQGLRPWDDYLHLFMLDFEEDKLKDLQREFDAAGLVLHRYWKDFYKIFEKEGTSLIDTYLHPGELLPFRYPAANLFVMTLEKRNEVEDVYVHRSEHFYSYWSFDRFHYTQIQTIAKVPFGPMMIPIPGDPDTYLSRVFGLPGYPDLWRQYAQERCWEHRTESTAPEGASFVELERPLKRL